LHYVAVSLCGNVIREAWLVLGWVTIHGFTISICNQPPRPTQVSYAVGWAKGQWQCSAAGKVTAGLASHWPCVTDSMVYPLTSQMAYGRQLRTPPTVL